MYRPPNMPVSIRIIKCLLLGIVIHFAESMHFQRHTCYLIHHILFSVNRCHENTCYACSSQEWCSPWSPMRRFMPKLMASVLTISFLPSAFGAISSTTFLGIEISTWTNCLLNKLEVWIVDPSIFFSAHVDFPDVIFSWSSEAEENKFTKTPPDAEQPRSFVQRLGKQPWDSMGSTRRAEDFQGSLNHPYGKDQTMQTYGDFEGFALNSALFGLVIEWPSTFRWLCWGLS